MPMPMGQVSGRHVDGQALLDLVHELERVAAFAIQLVDEGDDRACRAGDRPRSSLRVWFSMPLAASSTMTAESTAVRVR